MAKIYSHGNRRTRFARTDSSSFCFANRHNRSCSMVENILSILYEDNHCIAVIKPHGMLAQADRNKEQCLLEEVKTFIKKRDKKPGRVFLGLVHRLDRPVGGIMLFAKTSKGASRLSEAIRSHLLD